MLRVLVVTGTIRTGRRTEKVAGLVLEELKKRESVAAVPLDIRDLNLPVLTERYKYLKPEEIPAGLEVWREAVLDADAIILCVPEYNSGYPAALKNVLDSLISEYRRKPFGIAAVSAGNSGLMMLASLRNVLYNLGAFAVPTTFRAIQAAKAWDESGKLVNEHYTKNANALIDDVLFYATAFKSQIQP